jgi:Holliday junction resolvasome RuvABC DNA-binding subunit
LAALGYSDDKIEAIKKALIDDLTGGKVAKMVRLGIIKEDDVLNKLKDLGVPEDLAKIAIDSMFNVPSDSVIVKLYKAGRIDRETALRLLRMNGYKREWAEWILEATKEEKVEKDKDLSKSEVMRLRRYGIIDDNTFISFMKALGYDELEADYLLKLTKATIPTQEPPKPKTLTKDNILRAFELGVIREDEARNMLKALRYDDTSINVLIELAKARMNKEPEELKRDLTKADVLKALRLGLITRDQADAYLTALGYDERERAILLQFADIKEEVRQVRKTLPAATVARAFQLKIIDALTFETYLRLLGYGDFEIRILKALYAPKAS